MVKPQGETSEGFEGVVAFILRYDMIKESFCILVHFFCLQFTFIGFSFKFIFGSGLFDKKSFWNYSEGVLCFVPESNKIKCYGLGSFLPLSFSIS